MKTVEWDRLVKRLSGQLQRDSLAYCQGHVNDNRPPEKRHGDFAKHTSEVYRS